MLDGGSSDALDGGSGIDVAVFDGALAGYSVARSSGGYTVCARNGGEGIDTLTGVEVLRFADMTVNLTVRDQAAQAP